MYKEGGESINAALIGIAAGVIATAAISVVQYPFWTRWGMVGILEWHENQCIAARLLKRRPEELTKEGLMLHFLNGGLAALCYAFVVDNYLFLRMDVNLQGVLFGILLWLATLAPIHKPITGVSIIRHPLGRAPIALSLALHMVYGVIVARLVEAWLVLS